MADQQAEVKMSETDPHRIRVAFLAPPASYTHQAALKAFSGDEYELEPQLSIPDVFHAVQAGDAYYGVVPFENSSNGSVVMTLDCFVDRDNDFADVSVDGEVFMGVQHCLVGLNQSKPAFEPRHRLSPSSSGQATPTKSEPAPKKPRSQPLADLKGITDIYSNPQAFGQCQRFLSTYLKQADYHEVASTSKGAEIVKEMSSPNTAAISSELAADVYGLVLLAKDIQDREDNTTRFLLLHKDRDFLLPRYGSPDQAEFHWKSLFVFSVDHESRGALAEALLVFAKHKLNLTHFNSRPTRLRPWHYFFIVECECKGTRSALADQIGKAISDLDTVAEVQRCLGFWREDPTGPAKP